MQEPGNILKASLNQKGNLLADIIECLGDKIVFRQIYQDTQKTLLPANYFFPSLGSSLLCVIFIFKVLFVTPSTSQLILSRPRKPSRMRLSLFNHSSKFPWTVILALPVSRLQPWPRGCNTSVLGPMSTHGAWRMKWISHLSWTRGLRVQKGQFLRETSAIGL